MRKKALKIILISVSMLSLAGCGKEELPTQTVEPIEAIKPTETQPIESEPIKETTSVLEIDGVSYETAPMDSIEVISIDEDGNTELLIEDIKVDEDGQITPKKQLRTETDSGVTVSEIEDTKESLNGNSEKVFDNSLSNIEPVDFSESDSKSETLSAEDLSRLESEIIQNIDKNTMREAKESLRRALKDSVRILVDEGHSEFESFTDEVIDSMSEEEIIELNGKVDKAIRGY